MGRVRIIKFRRDRSIWGGDLLADRVEHLRRCPDGAEWPRAFDELRRLRFIPNLGTEAYDRLIPLP